MEGESIPALGHTTEIKNAKEATCTDDGYTGDEVCTVCNQTVTQGAVIAALGHTWNAGTVTIPSTCTTAGVKNYTCTVCGAAKTETIDALGHSYTATVVEPTCTAKGYTFYECTRCAASYKDNETAMIDHEPTILNAKEATCTAAGYAGDEVCTVCNQTIQQGKAIAALGHTWNTGAVTIPSTCTTAGVKTYTCTVCDTTKTETIAALGHSYTATVVEPTCTAKGYTLYECTRCSASYKDSETAMIDHELTIQNAREATEIQKGYTGDLVCVNCGEVLEKGEVIPLLTHTHVEGEAEEIKYLAPDCGTTGFRDMAVYCTICGTQLSRTRTYLDALAHQWSQGEETKEATCTEAGEKTYICERCGVKKTEIISRINHNYLEMSKVEATCTKAGYTEYTCQTCSRSYKDNYTSALGHEFVAVTIVPSTCTNAGYTIYECSRCDASYRADYTSATGEHSWGETPETSVSEPDKDGVVTTTKTYTCGKCGTSKTEQVKTLTLQNGDSNYTMNVDIPVISGEQKDPGDWNQRKETVAGMSDAEAHNTVGQEAANVINDVLDQNKTPDGVDDETAKKIQDAVENEKNITTKVVTEVGATTDTSALEEQFGGQVVQALNIEIQLLADDEELGTINQTQTEIPFAVELSEEAARTLGDDVSVVRIHDGEMTELDARRDGNTVYFSSDKFSDYVIMSKSTSVDIQNASVEVSDGVYTGKAVTPTVTVTYDGDQLQEDTDYTLAYSNNIEAGTATVILTGMGKYTGMVKATFQIEGEHIHSEVTERRNVIEATCTSEGSYDEVTYCALCDEELKTETVTLEKIDHEAADDRDGVETATCAQRGYTGDIICKYCGTVLEEGMVTTKLSHTYDDGVETISPTCTDEGTMTYTCTVCGDTKTETIAALGQEHSYTKTVVAPTYTAEGYTLYECIYCGDSYKSDVTEKLNYLKGDVDGNGKVDLKDVTLLFQFVNGQIDALDNAPAAEVTGDESIDLKDVTLLFQYVNGQIDTLG
jgi:hypothetical protein